MELIAPCSDGLVRATVWTDHGTSSATFRTVGEARAWAAAAANRQPTRRTSQSSPVETIEETDETIIQFPR